MDGSQRKLQFKCTIILRPMFCRSWWAILCKKVSLRGELTQSSLARKGQELLLQEEFYKLCILCQETVQGLLTLTTRLPGSKYISLKSIFFLTFSDLKLLYKLSGRIPFKGVLYSFRSVQLFYFYKKRPCLSLVTGQAIKSTVILDVAMLCAVGMHSAKQGNHPTAFVMSLYLFSTQHVQ